MKAWSVALIALAALAVGTGGGYWLGHRGGAAPKEAEAPAEGAKEEESPTATVDVIPLRRASLAARTVAYGTVVAPASDVRVVSVPFESHVTKILVSPGQTVTAGQPLIEVQASAATTLALEEARSVAAAAEHDLQSVKERYDQKLATNAELSAAQSAQRQAKARLAGLDQAGAGEGRQLKAESAGIVSKIDVQIGQIVPVGGPLVEVIAQDKIAVKLGVEAPATRQLTAGQLVKLRSVDDAAAPALAGKILLIGQRVDPATRLVDVLVDLPPQARLSLDSFVEAEITGAPAEGWIVPRSAVLPAETGGYQIFTVADGKAVLHAVHIGIENDRDVQIIADDLKEGDSVVTVGNYELESGMKVQVRPAPADAPEPAPGAVQPATTAPADRDGGSQ